jgi:DNA-binding transcriptional MerR regulator
MKDERTIAYDLATYIEWIKLIREARDIGFSIEEIRDFIALSTPSSQPAENK